MRTDFRPSYPSPLVAREPKGGGALYPGTGIFIPGGGTAPDRAALVPPRVGVWLERQRRWHDAFMKMVPNLRRYWALYRNFDDGPAAGPGQEWRDRTVVPECFKILQTRLPKKVLGLWARPEPFVVEGRGFRDQEYEAMVFDLMATLLDEIGKGTMNADLFLKRIIDGEIYCEVMGHVWWEVRWKREFEWIRTKERILDPNTGRPAGWKPIEVLEMLMDGIDLHWHGLDSVAADLTGANRWKIMRINTSLEALITEDEKYRKMNSGQQLYKNLNLLKFQMAANSPTPDGYSEPRDTERWPLEQEMRRAEPGETAVEMWICYDNLHRTTTKILNRSLEIAHGYTDTPSGRDPLIGVPCVPIPGRVIGDSYYNWIGPLAAYQTKIKRARGDEILINLWQQYIHREGALRSSQMFWRPGGFMSISTEDPSRPLSDSIMLLPRKPVFQEAFAEEGWAQQQAESTASADAVSQGVEATQKSRDVTAAEVNQRVMSSAGRAQFEVLYHEMVFKKPLLQMVFDLAKMNMTEAKQVRILNDEGDEEGRRDITLQDIQRPIDIIVGGGIMEATQQERISEIREISAMIAQPPFTEYARVPELMTDLIKATRTLSKRSKRYVKSEEQVQADRAAQMAAEMAAAGTPAGPGGPAAPLAEGGGPPGAAGPQQPAGAAKEDQAGRPGEVEETV